MKLSDLLVFDDILIQCHDIPDADTIASGFALYTYLTEQGKKAELIYSGKLPIQKSNLTLMLTELQIPIRYVTPEEAAKMSVGTLVLVDCQYGEGNVTKIKADAVAVIDHHERCIPEGKYIEIKSAYGSCATLLYKMLLEEGYDVNKNRYLATALYYGLYMDTNNFGEIRHPFDMDLMEDMHILEQVVNKMRNSNYTIEEMQIAGRAMTDYLYNDEKRFAIVKAEPCDPNLLGMINDFTLQVDKIDLCITYNEMPNGYKLSVRSCARDMTANEIARFVTAGIGNGGGHKNKAGGFINKGYYEKEYSGMDVRDYLNQKILELYNSFDVIDVSKDRLNEKKAERYRHLPVTVGYVFTTEVAPKGEMILIRTLEGDVSVVADDSKIILIGVQGEIYPCDIKQFLENYEPLPGEYGKHYEYEPKVKIKSTGEFFELCKKAKLCKRSSDAYVYAHKINRLTKVFTKWDYDNYMYGEEEDYLVCKETDPSDIYIVQSYIFDELYEKC